MSTDMRAVQAHLRAPFTPAAVHFKIQTNPKGAQGSALIVAFIDARLVAERLNHVCPGDWSESFKEPMGKAVVCRLTVLGTSHEDVGYGDGASPDMAVKSMYSDAFKRAAVKHGIGAFLYALPKMFVKAADLKNAGNNWYMTPGAENQLRGNYQRWLARKDVADRFGVPIDHGDELAAPAGEIPQNFDNTAHVESVTSLARAKNIGARAMTALLDEAGVPANADPHARLGYASIDQLVQVRESLERVAA